MQSGKNKLDGSVATLARERIGRFGILARQHNLGDAPAETGSGEGGKLARRVGYVATPIGPEATAARKGAGRHEVGVGHICPQGRQRVGGNGPATPLVTSRARILASDSLR